GRCLDPGRGHSSRVVSTKPGPNGGTGRESSGEGTGCSWCAKNMARTRRAMVLKALEDSNCPTACQHRAERLLVVGREGGLAAGRWRERRHGLHQGCHVLVVQAAVPGLDR